MIVLGLADADDLAEMQDQQPLDDGIQRMQHVLDPDDGDAACVDGADGRDQRPAFALGQPAGDLVEQQQLRFGRQRAGEFQPLALQAATGCPAGALALSISPVSTRISAQRSDTSASRWREPKAPATSRFSKTVSFSKGCGIWNVRPMPDRQRAIGGVRVTSLAAESGCCRYRRRYCR